MRWWAYLLAAVALAAAGCGGSSDDTTGSTSSVASTTTTTTTTTTTATTPEPAPDIEGDEMSRLPKAPAATEPGRLAGPTDTSEERAFLTSVFHDQQALWSREFDAAGIEYAPARLTIFVDEVHSACGTQSASVGPFYCPADHGVYLDTRFFDALGQSVGVRLGAFARAYVVAHEMGHHVQVLLGITGRVRAADQQDPAGTNARSVRLELQADCFAGIWGHSTQQRDILEQGDVEEALNAASAVGDDRIQKQSTGAVNPETWTHGSAAQRASWFRRGFESGDIDRCDTFAEQ
jgi:predicted metalloprotease